MFRWLRRILAAPVFDGDIDKTRAAWLLNIILLTLISRAVVIASRTLETTWAARARPISSADFASSSSALARMIPSWLFNR